MMPGMGKLDGHCLCGSISYTSDAEPVAQAICHCRNCQRQTGTAFSVVAVVPADQVDVKGDTLGKHTTVNEDSGQDTERWFCTACGSPLYSISAALPGMLIIKAGTLEDPSWLDPQLEVWGESAQPWVSEVEGRPRMPRSPQAAA
jgi:hypothetical protein